MARSYSTQVLKVLLLRKLPGRDPVQPLASWPKVKAVDEEGDSILDPSVR